MKKQWSYILRYVDTKFLIISILLILSNSVISQNITKPNIQGPMPGLNVNAYNGNLLCQRTDLFIPALGLDINITFSYNTSQTLIDHGFGNGWTHTFNIAYELDGQDVIIRREDGRKDVFNFNGGILESPVGIFDTLTQYLPDKYRLRAKDGTICFFEDTLSKRMTKMEDRYGNALQMTYNGNEIASLTDANSRSLEFTWSNGRMTKITDPVSNPPREILYTYGGNGMPVQVTDALGNTTQYEYDIDRKITKVIDKRGTACDITYNIKNAVSGITSPLTQQTITYSEPDLEVQLTEQVGTGTRVTTYTYDANGNVIQTQNPCCSSGLDLSYEYDADRNMTKFTDGNGNVYNYTYDSMGNRLSEMDPLGGARTWTYEPNFCLVNSYTNKNGNLSTYTYDASGNLTQRDIPENITETYTYDSSGNLLSSVDGNSNITIYTYDSNGYLISRNLPIGNETFTYDEVGRQTSMSDANSNLTNYTYDARDRVILITDPLGFTTNYTYDPNDNQIQMTDALGNTTTFTYDVLDRQTIIQRPIGTTTYTYDELDNQTSVTDPNGNLSQYEYNIQNLVSSLTNALGDQMIYIYDANGNQTAMTDFNGNVTNYTYDALDRLIMESAPLGQTFQYAYDANSNRISETDANGNLTTYTYDGIDRQVQLVDPVGTTQFSYDKNSNLTINTDANGNVTTYTYDVMDRRVSNTDALGFVSTMTYDAYGNVLSITDPNSNITTFTYDTRHLRLSDSNPETEITFYTYDGVGNIQTEDLPNGNTLTYTYDANYRLTGTNDLVGTVQNFTDDDNGNVLSETDANGNSTNYSYDALDRRVSTTDAMGETKNYTYDPNSNLVQSTDLNGNTSQYEYDAVDRQTKSIDALGNEINNTYDPQNNLTSLTDENGNATIYDYDAINRMVMETFADNTTKEYTYDPLNNLLARIDNNGDTTNYSYDARYLLIGRDYPGINDDVFSHDPGRRMTSAQNDHADILFTYDQANRILSESLNGQTTSYTYDIPNRIQTVSYPGGRQIEEQRDLRDRLSDIEEGSTTITTYAYDAADRITSKSRDNGVTSTYSYNDNDWITNLLHEQGLNLIAGFTYDFDNEGNKLFEEKLHHSTHSEQYGYDALYRVNDLKKGTLVAGNVPAPIQNDQFNYDGVNNRTSSLEAGVNRSYVTNNMNEYIVIINGGLVDPIHDDNGNLVFDGLHDYTYDTENRLLQVDGGITAEYHYDPFSRRIQKTTTLDTTHFYYDGWRVVEEQSNSSSTQATYVYGNWIDEILTMDRNGETYFYLPNSLGSVIAICDTNGVAVERYEYDAFGKANILDNSFNALSNSAIDNPYMFNGRRWDTETDFYYYRHRYYDPGNGRFLQRDPFGYIDGMNMYAYAKNDPINRIDPMGSYSFSINDRNCTITLNFKILLIFKDGIGAANKWTGPGKRAWAVKAKNQIERVWSGKRVLVGKRGTWRITLVQDDECEEMPYAVLRFKPCPCPKGYKAMLNISTTANVGAANDNRATVTKIPVGGAAGSYVSGKTATLDSEDLTPRPKGLAKGQIPIAHEFGHMIGLDHPGKGLGVAPNSIPEYKTRAGKSTAIGKPKDNILGMGMKVRRGHVKIWKDELDKKRRRCGPYK